MTPVVTGEIPGGTRKPPRQHATEAGFDNTVREGQWAVRRGELPRVWRRAAGCGCRAALDERVPRDTL